MTERPTLRTAHSAAKRALLLAAIGMLALTGGCVRIGGKPPERLLSIETQNRLPAGNSVTSPVEGALFVEVPGVAKAIDTQRVAVRAAPNSYAYVKKALWVDSPGRQFQKLLSETIAAKTGRLVLDPEQYVSTIGHILQGDLTEFGIDAASGQAIVTYDASLVSADGLSVKQQRFTAHRSVSAIDAESVAPAISDAANEVAAAVADWVKAGS